MSNHISRPLALIILDGWGVSQQTEGNAISLAHTPNYDAVCANFPVTALSASGTPVGLDAEAPGNAEVGHLTIGAGRIVQTDIARISEAVSSGAILENEVLRSAFGRASGRHSPVHFIGSLSNSAVHSDQETLFALLRMAKREGVGEVYVHGILEGRDLQTRTADVYVDALEIKMADIGIGKIASLCGRYFAMDEGENWKRTARAFTMLVHGEGERNFDAVSAIRASYLRGIADEFIAPLVIEQRIDVPLATVKEGDLVVFFNHEAAPMRQLVRSLSVPDASAAKPRVETVCLTEYDRSFGLPVAFERSQESNVLARVFQRNGVQNYRISESARAAHISDHFNSGTSPSSGLEQHLVISGRDGRALEAWPESDSFKIADQCLRAIESDRQAVFIVNFPAADLSAGTGSLENTIEAAQYVDTCLGGILEKVQSVNGVVLITSSHGGCEEMGEWSFGASTINASANPVPFHLVDYAAPGIRLAESGSLTDVAPTILGILGIEKPAEMSGSDLRRS